MNKIEKEPLPFLQNSEALKNIANENKRMKQQEKLLQLINQISVDVRKGQESASKAYGSIIKQYGKEKIQAISSSLSPENIIRKVFGVSDNSLFGKLLNKYEDRKNERKEAKKEKEDFIKNYLENTKPGQLIAKRGDAKERAGQLYDMKQQREAELAKRSQEITKKIELKDKFGVGGPSKKELEEYDRIKSSLDVFVKDLNRIGLNRILEKENNNKKVLAPTKSLIDGNKKKIQDVENESENSKKQDVLIKTLKNIEENTKKTVEKKPTDRQKLEADSKQGIFGKIFSALFGGAILSKTLGGLFSSAKLKIAGIFKSIAKNIWDSVKKFSGGIIDSVKKVFNPRAILKVASKLFLPITIIGSIFSAVKEGLAEFAESGSFKDAIISGIGGVLEFLTFGLFSKEQFESSVKWIEEKHEQLVKIVSDNIIEPIMNMFKRIGDWFGEKWKGLKELFGFEDKQKVEQKPHRNVTDTRGRQQPEKPEPKNNYRNVVAVEEEIKRNSKQESKVASNVVAPQTTINTNNKTYISPSKPVRNREDSYNNYIGVGLRG